MTHATRNGGPIPGYRPWGSGGQPTEQDREEAPRQEAVYQCAEGHGFTLTFAATAEPPPMWDCPKHGHPALLDGAAAGAAGEKGKPAKTPWDHVRERRSIPELEVTLAEALAGVRSARAGAAS